MFWGILAVLASVVVAPQTGVEVARGGVVLPNVDDDGRRCGTSLTCNDSTDEVVNGSRDAEDLTTVHVPRSAPIEISGPVRVFVKHGKNWHSVRSGERVRGTVGVEATAVTTSRIRVKIGSQVVPMRVAPLRTHHHLQDVREVLVTNDLHVPADGEGIVGELLKLRRAAKPGFLKDLETAAGPTPVRHLAIEDLWTQDVIEPAYATAGSHRMPILIHTPLATAAVLHGPDIGVVHVSGQGSSVDAGGNIETIPPYPGRPEGRVVMGKRPDELPNTQLRNLLGDPLLLDTSWLANAHVDEFVQFLPKPGGWRMAVADPLAGLELLRRLAPESKLATGFRPGEPVFLDWAKLEFIRASPTVAETLAKVRTANETAAHRIEENLAELRRESGVTDVIRIPALFEEIPKVEPSIAEAGMGGLLPTAVNGVVLDRHRYLAPDPHNAAFRDAIRAAYGKAGYSVEFVDQWRTHHLAGGGGLHCGTNVLREM